jgi:hypothetical protein
MPWKCPNPECLPTDQAPQKDTTFRDQEMWTCSNCGIMANKEEFTQVD